MGITVNVNDGTYDPSFVDFKQDYLADELTVSELKQKYDLTPSAYSRLQRRVTSETGFRKGTRYEPKEYYVRVTRAGTYALLKRINGRQEYIRSFKDMNELEVAVEWLREHDWDIIAYKKYVGTFKEEPANYSYIGGKWVVHKNINAEPLYFGAVDTEEEAKEIVAWLKQNRWDKLEFQKVKHKWNLNEKNNHDHYYYNVKTREWGVYRKGVFYASYNEKEDAMKAVEWLREHNWNKKEFERRYNE